MKIKGRSILVIALLVFGSYAIYDFMHQKTVSEQDAQESRLLTVEFDQVDKVELENPNGKIVLKRSIDGWSMEEPLQDLADNMAVEDYIKSLATERIMEVAKEGSQDGESIDWNTYGLETPHGKVTLTSTDGKSNTFEISDKRNFEDNIFARRDQENRVLVLNSIWEKKINKTVLDFRDRRFLRHKIASVDEFKVKSQQALVHLKMVDGKWTALSPAKIELDQNKVRELLQVIVDARASEYLENKSLPQHKVLFTVDLNLGEKKWQAIVGQAPNKAILAETSDPKFVMKMEPGALDRFITLRVNELQAESVEENESQPKSADGQKAMLANKDKDKVKKKVQK